MRYRMREKIWTIRDRYVIRDDKDVELFQVEGKLLTIGKKLKVSGIEGEELARIEQKVWSLRPTYFLHRPGSQSARIRRMFRPIFKPRFVIEAPNQAPIEIDGNLWAHEYEITQASNRIGHVSKKFFSWADSYCVDLDDDQDQVLLLSAAIVIDLVSHESDAAAAST